MTCKGCNTSLPGGTVGPAPYYEQVNKPVVQDHASVYASTCYPAGIVFEDDWAVPVKDADPIAVKLVNVSNVSVGAQLYHALYGYFKIVHWVPATQTAGLVNEQKGNASPGTLVPKDTPFIIAPTPCCEDETSTLFPFLAADFTAQPANQNLTIQVTSTFGLRVQDLVRISTGVYRLLTINSSREIVIRNEGAGITPGTLVSALGTNGEFQYLIVSETSSACSAPTVQLARLISCDGNTEKILAGTYPGQVPVLQNVSGSTVRFQLLDTVTRVCTELTANLAILPAVTTYVLGVSSTAGFSIGDILEINFNTLRFVITAVNVGTLNVTSTPGAPGISLLIPSGSPVCKAVSSETIGNEIDALQAADTNLQNQINSVYTVRLNQQYITTDKFAATSATGTISSTSGIIDGNEVTLIITNNTTRPAIINLTTVAKLQAEWQILTLGVGIFAVPETLFYNFVEIRTGVIGSTAFSAYNFQAQEREQRHVPENYTLTFSTTVPFHHALTLPPGHEMRSKCKGQVVLFATNGANELRNIDVSSYIQAFAVVV